MARNKKTDAPPVKRAERATQRYQATLDPELAKNVNAICAFLGISMSDYVNARLSPLVEKELPEVLATRGFRRDPKPGP